MKKIFYSSLLLFSSFYIVSAQVNSNAPVVNAASGENAFLDASTNFNNLDNNGKGLVFPQTDLTQWTFKVDVLDGINFPTAFDGMIVYNTGTGTTQSGQGVQVSVVSGFYYFYNPGATDNITNGFWKPMGGGLGNLTGDITSVGNTTTIVANAVTSAKIADATIVAADLAQMGAATGQYLSWSGTAWVLTTPPQYLTQDFAATAGLTTFTLTQTPKPGSLQLYINGIRISSTAISSTGTTATYAPGGNNSYALIAGDRVQITYVY